MPSFLCVSGLKIHSEQQLGQCMSITSSGSYSCCDGWLLQPALPLAVSERISVDLAPLPSVLFVSPMEKALFSGSPSCQRSIPCSLAGQSPEEGREVEGQRTAPDGLSLGWVVGIPLPHCDCSHRTPWRIPLSLLASLEGDHSC